MSARPRNKTSIAVWLTTKQAIDRLCKARGISVVEYIDALVKADSGPKVVDTGPNYSIPTFIAHVETQPVYTGGRFQPDRFYLVDLERRIVYAKDGYPDLRSALSEDEGRCRAYPGSMLNTDPFSAFHVV